jgi:hypothetical protein
MTTRGSLLILIGFLAIQTFCAQKSVPDFPVDIAYVREMSFIPEVDTWTRCQDSGFSKDSIAVATQWDALYSRITPHCSQQTARDLSNWAKEQMAGYKKNPDLSRLHFSPCRMDTIRNKILFQATVDTLPTHNPAVTRILKLYLMYDLIDQKVQRVTVTIRGVVKE